MATSKDIRVSTQLSPIAGGNNVETSHGGPIAPTICYDALFEQGELDVSPMVRSTFFPFSLFFSLAFSFFFSLRLAFSNKSCSFF